MKKTPLIDDCNKIVNLEINRLTNRRGGLTGPALVAPIGMPAKGFVTGDFDLRPLHVLSSIAPGLLVSFHRFSILDFSPILP